MLHPTSSPHLSIEIVMEAFLSKPYRIKNHFAPCSVLKASLSTILWEGVD